MVDIDEMVMDACQKFMPSVNHPYLEKKRGDNYKVVVGDAFKLMEEFKVCLCQCVCVTGGYLRCVCSQK